MKKNVFQSPALESETIETLSAKLLLSNNQLLESNKKLEQVQREREEMLANISHDLRAPITAIRSAVDYLLSGQEHKRRPCNSRSAGGKRPCRSLCL